MTTTTTEREPGWYDDPLGRGIERWHDGGNWTPRTRDTRAPWRSLAGPTLALVPLLLASAFVNAWLALAFQGRRRVVDGLDAGTRTAADFRDNEDLLTHLGVVNLALAVAIVVLWLVWFRVATDDARTLRDVRYPRWAVWGWLVPGLNLVRPMQMVDDLWLAGDESRDAEARPSRMPTLLPLWWGLTLLATGLLVAGDRLTLTDSADRAERIRLLHRGAGVLRFGTAIAALAALLAAYVVVRITARVALRRSRAERSSGRTVAP